MGSLPKVSFTHIGHKAGSVPLDGALPPLALGEATLSDLSEAALFQCLQS